MRLHAGFRYYEVLEAEAAVVRRVYEAYTQEGLSINAIAHRLNEEQIPARTGTARWERSTVWGMLRNPAYQGRACSGKTELRLRQRITRPLRKRQGLPSRNNANHERPRPDWIEMAVPALVSEATFALAQEQLECNKHHSPRRTIEPSLLQGMLVCERCGYSLYSTSNQTSTRIARDQNGLARRGPVRVKQLNTLLCPTIGLAVNTEDYATKKGAGKIHAFVPRPGAA